MRRVNPLNRLVKNILAVVLSVSGLSGADLSFDPPQYSGLFCSSLLGIGCTETTRIRNNSSSLLTDVTIVHAYKGLGLGLGNQIGIDGSSKTMALDGDAAEYSGMLSDYAWLNGLVDLSLFNKGIVYRPGNFAPVNPSNQSDEHTIYVQNLLGISFEAEKYYATYTKDGLVYNTRLYPTGAKLVSLTPTGRSVLERDTGTNTPVYFTVKLSEKPTEGPLYVHYAVSPGTATPVLDYSAAAYSGILTFPKNSSILAQTITVSVVGDDINESNETFSVSLTSLASSDNEFFIDESLQNSTVTIIDDDGDGGGVNPIIYLPGVVDTVDTYQTTLMSPFYQRVIKTKISDQPGMTLDAVYLGADMMADVVYSAANMPVLMSLYDPSTGVITQLYEQANPTEKLAALIVKGTIKGTTPLFTIPAMAKKEAYILMKYLDYEALYLGGGPNCLLFSSTGANAVPGMPSCVASDVQYLDAFHQEAYDRCKVSHGEPCRPEHHGRSGGGDPTYPGYDPTYDHKYGCYECTIGATDLVRSVDNFAIRPEKFDMTSVHYDWAHLLRAGEDYNTTIKAYTYGTTTPTPDYNQSRSNLTLNQTLYYQDGTTAGIVPMEGTLAWGESDFNISDGISLDPSTGTNEIAGITFDEVGRVQIGLSDMEWAAVDLNNPEDTTPANCSGAYICGDRNVTFIPHHFDFADLNITNNNGDPGTFTYIADEVGEMAARIQTTMRALNKDGNATRNFAAFPLWENSVIVTPAVAKSTYLHLDANETIIDNALIGFADGNKTILWDETNTSQQLRFNFDREVRLPAAAFDVNGSDLNITIASVYLDSVTRPGEVHTATVSGDRNETADGSATFVYGRLIPRDIRVFGATMPVIASGWYEVFNATVLGGTALPASRNETGWFVNAVHDDLTDGDAMVTQLQDGTAPSAAMVPAISGASASGMESFDFTPYGLGLGSYKAHVDTAPWLWHGVNALEYVDPLTGNTAADCLHHPCFNLTIVPGVGATGSAKSESEGTKGSKKTESGGPWKSRKDYAPAVR